VDKQTLDLIEQPLYDFGEAAYTLRVPKSTLRAWFLGQPGFNKVFELKSKEPRLLSFANLLEAHTLSAIRKIHGVYLNKVRQALRNIEKRFDSDIPGHPLLDSRLRTNNVHLFLDELATLTVISDNNQTAMRQLLEKFLQRIEIQQNKVRFFPYVVKPGVEDTKAVALDPRIQFGKAILAKRGVATFIIAERFRAGESVIELARDYRIGEDEIQDALRYETYKLEAA